MHTVPRPKKRFFSLIEILMAIVILFILIAILLPSLTRAREYALQASCLSNTRHIAMGFRQYYEEWEEWPICEYWLDDFRLVYPYIKQDGMFRCPKRQATWGNYGVWDEEGNLRNGDFYVSGKMEDIEKNMNFNNGMGNNPYHFDPSNPSPGTEAVMAAKDINDRIVYEKYWDAHFGGRDFNVFFVSDMHHQKEPTGFTRYWTLDDRGWIDTSLDPYPVGLSYLTEPGQGFEAPEGAGDEGGPELGDCTFCGGDGVKDNDQPCNKCGGDGWL